MISGFGGHPYVRVIDAQGCARVQEDFSAMPCGAAIIDGGTDPIDAGTIDCAELAPAACLQAGCVPTFDDACCSSCNPVGCADCTNWTYYACLPFVETCTAPQCSRPLTGICSPIALDCSGAHPSDEDSCDIAGCVPAYPSGTGEPNLAEAICVPIHANVCTVSCRRAEPPCPSRTVAEGDGSCYTDRCIPELVCRS